MVSAAQFVSIPKSAVDPPKGINSSNGEVLLAVSVLGDCCFEAKSILCPFSRGQGARGEEVEGGVRVISLQGLGDLALFVLAGE